MKDTLQRLADMAVGISSPETVQEDNFGFTMDIHETPIDFFALEDDTGTAYCRALVGSCGDSPCPVSFAEAALRGNFFWRATDGATLSLNESENAIYLTDRFDDTAFEDEGAFGAYIDGFLRMLQDWKARLATTISAEEVQK